MSEAPSARSPTCPEVFDCEARSIVSSTEILKLLEVPEAHKTRMAIEEAKQKGIAKYSCPLCSRTLSLRGGLESRFVMHFAHPREPEHHCPYKTSDNHTPDELAAMKYNGLKETVDHRLVKARLLRGLRRDPGTESNSLRSEKIYRAKLPDKDWRRPDVAARWNGRSLVFEAQLATTFVTVIANRRNFYTANGAELIWIFAKCPDADFMPFTNKDIFYNNNCNLFVVNDQTDAESIKQNRLVLEAWWPDPSTFSSDRASIDWCSQMVSLQQLTFDSEKRVVFFFDFDAAITEKKQREEREEIAFEQQQKQVVVVDDRVPPGTSLAFNFQYPSIPQNRHPDYAEDPDIAGLDLAVRNGDSSAVWRQLRRVVTGEPRLDSISVFKVFAAQHLIAPIETFAERQRAIHFEAILSALFSLAAGQPLGNGYSNLKEVENWIYRSHTCHYVLFLRAAKTLRRELALEVKNPHSTARKHIAEFREAREIGDRSAINFDQDRSLDNIFRLAFPELAEDIDKLKKPD